MKYSICLILFLGISSSSIAQVDYLDIKDSLFNLSCGDIPMADVIKSKTNLETLDPSCLSKNADQYYRNLGYTYFIYAAKTDDYSYMSKAIAAYNKCLIINPTDYKSRWDLALCYYFNKEYQNSINSGKIQRICSKGVFRQKRTQANG